MAAGLENWVPTIVYGANGLISGYGEKQFGATGAPPTRAPAARSCTAVSLGNSRSGLECWGGAGRGFARARATGRALHNRRRGGGTFSSPSRCDLQSNTHTQSSACKLQLGPLQLPRVAPSERVGGRVLAGRAHRRRQVCLVGPIAVLCTPQHTPWWQGGQGGLMRENVRKECARTATRLCMGPLPA